MCRARSNVERFPDEFRLWIGELERLHWWVKAGYPLDPAALEFVEMEALAMLTRFREVRDIEAQMPRAED